VHSWDFGLLFLDLLASFRRIYHLGFCWSHNGQKGSKGCSSARERCRGFIGHYYQWMGRLGTLKEAKQVPWCSILANRRSSKKSVNVGKARVPTLYLHGSAWYQQGCQEDRKKAAGSAVSRSSKTALQFDTAVYFLLRYLAWLVWRRLRLPPNEVLWLGARKAARHQQATLGRSNRTLNRNHSQLSWLPDCQHPLLIRTASYAQPLASSRGFSQGIFSLPQALSLTFFAVGHPVHFNHV